MTTAEKSTTIRTHMNPALDKALEFAVAKHSSQLNKYSGEPYILHVYRVYKGVRDAGFSEVFQKVALLHDVLEDTDATFTDLLKEFGVEVAHAVDALSKRNGESNEQYYYRVRANEIAAVVKFYDIKDNFRRNHLIEDADTRLRMAKKYSLGIDILNGTAHA
jgi:(p)ppGpp synthase/HD superfamily hydrolase